MKQPTAKDMTDAAAELKSTMAEARETLQVIQSYWRDDPEISREISDAIEEFDDVARDLTSRIDAHAEQLAKEEERREGEKADGEGKEAAGRP